MPKFPYGTYATEIENVRPKPVALRDVDPESEKFIGILNSIRDYGFTSAILARPKTDASTGEEYIELVDGAHRYTACKMLGLPKITVCVKEMDDSEAYITQILMNLHKNETKPVEYARHLLRILNLNRAMTLAQLAQKLCKSAQWVQQRLSINDIKDESTLELVNTGKIPLINAYQLAKLEPKDQIEFRERALTTPSEEFVLAVNRHIRNLKEQRRQGNANVVVEFTAVPVGRSVKVINEEIGSNLALKQHQFKTVEEAWNGALKWAIQLDPVTVATKKANYEAEKKAREDAKAAKKAERDAAKAKLEDAKLSTLNYGAN